MESLEGYRTELLKLRREAETAFDRTVVTLSGGALGVSFAFVKDFVPGIAADPGYLMAAWGSWVASLACTLASHYFSALALTRALEQVDRGTINRESPGGGFTATTKVLNALGGLGFVAGVVLMGLFVARNLR